MDGASDMSLESAFEVCPLALFSRYRPKLMKVMSIVLVSNRVVGFVCCELSRDTSMDATLKKKAAEVPKTTRTSIVGEPWLSDLYAEM
jgi:hypothetical protein